MSLIYTSVSRGSTILVEHQSNNKRDFSSAAQAILSRIPPSDGKLTYVWEQYLFHYVSTDGVVFLTMGDDSLGRRMPFAFLSDLQKKFMNNYSTDAIISSDPYGLGDFEPELSKLMKQYTEAPPPDALRQAQADLAGVRDVMVSNIDAILSRGERIELLVDKTDNLSGQAFAFRSGARNVRRQMWWKNAKVTALASFVVIFLFYLFIAQFCGYGLGSCGAAEKPKGA